MTHFSWVSYEEAFLSTPLIMPVKHSSLSVIKIKSVTIKTPAITKGIIIDFSALLLVIKWVKKKTPSRMFFFFAAIWPWLRWFEGSLSESVVEVSLSNSWSLRGTLFFSDCDFWTLYNAFSLFSDWFVHVSVFVSGFVIPREGVNLPVSLCVLQVLARRVQGGGEHQRLSGHLLSLLRGSPVPRTHGALHPVHGQPRGLHFLPAQDAWLQTLGVQPSQRSWWTPALLREVPALHALLPGLRVQTWTRVLLYLWVGAGVGIQRYNTTQCRQDILPLYYDKSKYIQLNR